LEPRQPIVATPLSIVLIAGAEGATERVWESAIITLLPYGAEGSRLRRVLLSAQPRWLVLGEACDERTIEVATFEARRTGQGTKVAVLGVPDDFARCERWIRAGVDCYLASSSTDKRIMEALDLSDRQDIVVVDICFQARVASLIRLLEPQVRLSDRELQLLKLAAEGLHSDEMAQGLHLTGHTVEFHFRNIISKMGVRNRTQAVARAVTLGLITVSDIVESLPVGGRLS
jgi:DNA-binding NarL/FixJ family response regulator